MDKLSPKDLIEMAEIAYEIGYGRQQLVREIMRIEKCSGMYAGDNLNYALDRVKGSNAYHAYRNMGSTIYRF